MGSLLVLSELVEQYGVDNEASGLTSETLMQLVVKSVGDANKDVA